MMLNLTLNVLMISIMIVSTLGENKTKDLYLMGLFPFTGVWDGGAAYLEATTMALEQINNRHDLLPEHRLNLIYNDTKVSNGKSYINYSYFTIR